MKLCNHSDWLSLRVHRNDISLLESNRLQDLVDTIPDPDTQCPGLLVLIGGPAKSTAVQHFTSDKPIRKASGGRRKRCNGIELYLGKFQGPHTWPVLVANGELPYHASKSGGSTIDCHETTRLVLPRVRESVRGASMDEAVGLVYARLLCAFADVFCFFSADFGGFGPIVRRIAAWLEHGQPSTLPRATFPRVLVVTEGPTLDDRSKNRARDILLAELRAETNKNPFERFAAIDVVYVSPKGKVSAQTLHEDLGRALLEASEQVRVARVETRTLFSARHFSAFFKHACAHLARTVREPFDFIKTSRLQHPVSPKSEDHLCEFLKNITSPNDLTSFAIPMIASSILLDHYPPGMHGQLQPLVYRRVH